MAKECALYNQIKLSSDSDYVRVVFYIRTLVFFSLFFCLLSFDVKIFLDESKTSKTPRFIYWNVNLFDEQNLHNQFLKIVFKT